MIVANLYHHYSIHLFRHDVFTYYHSLKHSFRQYDVVSHQCLISTEELVYICLFDSHRNNASFHTNTDTSLSISMFLNLSHSRTLVMQNADGGTSSPERNSKTMMRQDRNTFTSSSAYKSAVSIDFTNKHKQMFVLQNLILLREADMDIKNLEYTNVVTFQTHKVNDHVAARNINTRQPISICFCMQRNPLSIN